MSSAFPNIAVVSAAEQHDAIRAALGGQVWWDDDRIHWMPEDHEIVIVLPDIAAHTSFDIDAWLERTRAEWAKRGVRL